MPTEIVDGVMRLHYADAGSGEAYLQPWVVRAGARDQDGPIFDLVRTLPIETEADEGRRRRRRILLYMNDATSGSPKRVPVEAMATALQLDPLRVGKDLAILKDEDLVTIYWTANATPWPTTATLTARGVQVAEEGWPQPGSVTDNSQRIQIGDNASIGALGVARGNIEQHVSQGDNAEFRQVLDELRAALKQATDLADEDRADGLDAVDRIYEEFERERPRRGRIESALRALSIVADVAGTAQGTTMVTELVGRLTPHVNHVCQGLT